MTTKEVPTTAADVAELVGGAVGEAFVAFTTERQLEREDLLAFTMSGLGGCRRQAAYRIARVPPSEEMTFGELREANLGTMIHTGLLPHLAKILGGSDEVSVTLRSGTLVVDGRSDLYSARYALCGDLKTQSPYKWVTVGDVAIPAHRLQVSGYGCALEQGGKAVRWIAWIYLDRSSGDDRIVVEEFTDELRVTVEQRCAELQLLAEAPDAAPRDERGPGLSLICDGCPWLRACWGPDARRGEVGAQRVLVQDDAAAEEALGFYDEARARERAAAEDKEFARAMLADRPPGVYGPWELGWTRPGRTADKDAAVTLLADAGIDVPQKVTSAKFVVKRAVRE